MGCKRLCFIFRRSFILLYARSYFYTLDEPENIDYYTKFVEEFKAKYEIYKEEKMKKLQQSMDKKEAINRVEKEIEEDNNKVKDEEQTTIAEPL